MLLESLFFAVLSTGMHASFDDVTVTMSHKRYRDWTVELPRETFTTVGGQIVLADGKYTFAAKMESSNLLLDLNGDGETDVKITGKTGSALLRHEDGFRYAIRLKRDANGWAYASSGAQVGKLQGTRIALLDQNNDGFFDSKGVDAILVGRGKIATWLGTTLLVNGELQSIRYDRETQQLQLLAYEGNTGSLSVTAGFHGQGKVLSAVVRSVDGQHCFDLATTQEAVQVPVGRYRLLTGKIGLGEQAVLVAPGFASAFKVSAETPQNLQWGGPVRAEFEYQRSSREIAFSPERIWYYGTLGEEYLNWKPAGKSPVFKILDSASKQEIAQAVFPGSG